MSIQSRKWHVFLVALFAMAMLALATGAWAQPAPPVYVDGDNGNDANDGLSWATAKKTIQAGIDAQSNSLRTHPNQVWVKTGVYNEKIQMKAGLLVMGGFRGDEVSTYGYNEKTHYVHRDVVKYPTIVDGSNVTAGSGGGQNVVKIDVGSWNGLDGLIITGGNATSGTGDDAHGGGVLMRGGDRFGLLSCVIVGNVATDGGGVYIENAQGTLSGERYGLRNSLVIGNSAENGGGIYVNNYNFAFRGLTVAYNTANTAGSAIALGHTDANNANAPLQNCLFAGNMGAEAVAEVTTDADPVLANCLFNGNADGDYYDDDSAGAVNGAASIDGLGNTNTVDGDPMFMMDQAGAITGTWTAAASYDSGTNRTVLTVTGAGYEANELFGKLIFPDTTDAANGAKVLVIAENTADTITVIGDASYAAASDGFKIADLKLAEGSAALDAGDNAYMQPEPMGTGYFAHIKDVSGAMRSAAYNTTDTVVTDIGAFETQKIYYVDLGAAINGDGSTWANAMNDIQSALDAQAGPRWVFVKKGEFALSGDNRGSETENMLFGMFSGSEDDGVWVFGGFEGTESHFHQRTMGEITKLDANAVNNGSNDNIWRRGFAVDGADFTWIDGFWFYHGRCHSGGSDIDRRGAGLFVKASSYPYEYTWSVVSNCKFSQNNSWTGGGGLFAKDSIIRVLNCEFHGNWSENEAGPGAGAYISSCPSVVNGCEFSGNNSQGAGGGIALEAGNSSFPIIVANSIISGNTADYGFDHPARMGGGLYYGHAFNRDDCTMDLVNCLITGNRSNQEGGGAAFKGGYINISNCTFSGNESWHTQNDLRYPGDMIFMENGDYSGFFGRARDINITNTIFDGPSTSTMIYCNDQYMVPDFQNCVFNNTEAGGNLVRVTSDGATDNFLNDAAAINAYGDSYGNSLADPQFAMFGPNAVSGTWDQTQTLTWGLQGPIRTRFTDNEASWADDELIGKMIVVNVTDHRLEGYIMDNGNNWLEVSHKYSYTTDWGLPEDANGKEYLFSDFTPQYGSPVIDAVTTGILTSSMDVYGYARPSDLPDIDNGGAMDIGAIEFAPTGFYTLNRESVDFGQQSTMFDSSARTIQVSAVGIDDVEISNVSISGTDAGEFSVKSFPSTVAQGATGDIEVVFSPSSTGSKSAILTIESNNAILPSQDVAITGVGNEPPTFSGAIDGGSVAEDTAYTGSIAGEASDTDDSVLTFSKVTDSYTGGGADWLTVGTDGALSGTPTNSDQAGASTWEVQVMDPKGGFSTETLTITVTAVDDAPVLADPVIMANARTNRAYSKDLDDDSSGQIVDEEGATLTYAEKGYTGPSGGSDWLTIGVDGALSGTPTNADIGRTTWTLAVSDGNSTSTTDLVITVTDANTAPAFTVDPMTRPNAYVGAAYSVDPITKGVTGNFEAIDIDGDTLQFSITAPATTWLNVSTDGQFSGIPASDDAGLSTFTLQVSDGEDTDTTTLEILVLPPAAADGDVWTLY